MNILADLRKKLIENSDESVRTGGQRYFREAVTLYGVRTKTVSIIGKEFYQKVKTLPRKEILDLCTELWQSGYLEESFVACQWSYTLRKNFEKEDFIIIESWIDLYVKNWASCDTLCNHTVAAFIDKFPEYLKDLERWAKSPNLWKRRASAVSLIIPAKEGRYLPEIFRIAGILLTDKEDMVQKGYGWMLKAASKPYQNEVFEYVYSHRKIMPRTALRYAIEKMPPELRQKAMLKG